jgi:hypothetical protein
LLVSVTVLATLVVPAAMVPNDRLPGESEIAVSPAPVRLIRCGDPAALSEIVISPGMLPRSVGAKFRLIMQVPLGARVDGLRGQLCDPPKFPLPVSPEMASGAVPVLVSVTVFEVLVVFSSWPAKVRLVADKRTAGLPVDRAKVAVTFRATLIVTVQEPVPVQAPLQPAKVEPEAAVALSVTDAPELKFAAQVPGQLMPEGLLDTEPPPVPARVTVSGKVAVLNVAVTFRAALIVTVQEPVPVQAPLQPAKLEPEAAVVLSVTDVPELKFAAQVPGQLMPEGLLDTEPVPVPASVTVSGKVAVLNVAVTAWPPFIVTVQVPVPLQAPPQPAKVEPEAAVAVNVTVLAILK